MNGTSGFQEVRSSTSQLQSSRLLHEQRHQFGRGAWHLLRTKELLRMATQVRMKNRLLPSSFDRIALCPGIRAIRETAPATVSSFFYRGN